MLTARTAGERAAFVPDERLVGARLIDVGCGPGSLTAGLAARVGAGGVVVGIDPAPEARAAATTALGALRDGASRAVVGGSVHALPVGGATVDVVFAHAVVEHLTDPLGALAEIRRVLRPGGALAVVASDWSGAVIGPGADGPAAARDVRAVVDAYRAVRRRAGADPDAGARLAAWCTEAGLGVVHHDAHLREDLVGAELARYLAERLPARARAAAVAWAGQAEPVRVRQRWVEVLAVAPGSRPGTT